MSLSCFTSRMFAAKNIRIPAFYYLLKSLCKIIIDSIFHIVQKEFTIEATWAWSYLCGKVLKYKFLLGEILVKNSISLSPIWIIIFSISSRVSFSQLLLKLFECFIKIFKFVGTRCSWSTPSLFIGSVFSSPYSLLIFAICAFFFSWSTFLGAYWEKGKNA